MKRRRKPGGQKNNLNACKRSWDAFWRRRALKPEDSWLSPIIADYMDGMRLDKPDMSEAEERVCEVAQTARGASMLILAEAARSGFIQQTEKGWDLAPGAKELGKFLNIERAALAALGLERRTRPVKSAIELIREGADS